MDKDLGADRALVPAASSLQAVSTKGFDHGEGLLEGSRYSPNLRKWLRSRKNRAGRMAVYRNPKDGIRYIGHRSVDDQWFHGAKLMRVLCVGARAESFAYPPKHCGPWELIEGFWESYALIGRCAIDPEHSGWWLGERWETDGDSRSCLWCGNHRQTLHRWTETVERERWTPQADTRPEGQDAQQGLGLPSGGGPEGMRQNTDDGLDVS